MSAATKITPPFSADDVLPGAQFIDAYQVALPGPDMSARMAAEKMLGRSPRWISRLMSARNALVAPFGLKRPEWDELKAGNRIGIFPVISETPQQILLGFDDKHMDFRVVVSMLSGKGCEHVALTTVVRKHNLLGQVYLAVVLPFHVIIVKSMLARLERQG